MEDGESKNERRKSNSEYLLIRKGPGFRLYGQKFL
jgi:hypothetical protein